MIRHVSRYFSHSKQALYFLLPALGGIAVFIVLLRIPPDPKNIVFMGYSLNRLLLLGFTLLGFLFFAGLTIRIMLDPIKWNARFDKLLSRPWMYYGFLFSSSLLLVVFWTVLFLPDERWGVYIAYIERFRPHLYWLLYCCAQAIAGLLWWKYQYNRASLDIRLKHILIHSSIFAAGFLLIWVYSLLTHSGFWPGNAFWGKLGVPLLTYQIFLAWLGAVLVLELLFLVKNSIHRPLWFDLGAALVIGLLAVILWGNEFLPPSTFNTPPHAPNFASYPSSDAIVYDRTAQSIMMGNHMNRAIDKPLYISYLVIIKFLTGSDFNGMIRLQLILFSMIPITLYWIGKSLHSRPLGIMVALLSVFKETNAIAATDLIQVSNVKMILTEMATTVGVLLFLIFFIRWLKHPSINRPALWISGGLLGLTGLIRLNIFAAIPFLLLAIGWSLKLKLKQWIVASALLLVFAGISLTPWMVRNWYSSGNPVAFIGVKTSGVIINQRYEPVVNREASDDPNFVNPEDLEPENTGVPAPFLAKYMLLGQNIGSHFIHNLLGITFMVPPTPVLFDLYQMIRLPYWSIQWDGTLLPGNAIFLILTMALIAFGIGTAYTRTGVAGLAPLFVILGYNLSTSLSLASGGRYLVPFDWGAILYFCIGIMELTVWVAAIHHGKINRPILAGKPADLDGSLMPRRKGRLLPSVVLVVGLFLVLGAVPVILENVFPKQFTAMEPSHELIDRYQGSIAAGFSSDQDVKDFISGPNAQWFMGTGLYPRFYRENEGDPQRQDALRGTFNYARTTFYLFNQKSMTVILPIETAPDYFPNAANLIVVGCQQANHFEALAVIVRADADHIYLRSAQHPTTCSGIQ